MDSFELFSAMIAGFLTDLQKRDGRSMRVWLGTKKPSRGARAFENNRWMLLRENNWGAWRRSRRRARWALLGIHGEN